MEHPSAKQIDPLKEILDWQHDHSIDDGARFKSIDDKQETMLDMLADQNRAMKEHITKVEPYLQGAAGFGVIWKFFVAVGGAVLVWVQIKSALWPHA